MTERASVALWLEGSSTLKLPFVDVCCRMQGWGRDIGTEALGAAVAFELMSSSVIEDSPFGVEGPGSLLKDAIGKIVGLSDEINVQDAKSTRKNGRRSLSVYSEILRKIYRQAQIEARFIVSWHAAAKSETMLSRLQTCRSVGTRNC